MRNRPRTRSGGRLVQVAGLNDLRNHLEAYYRFQSNTNDQTDYNRALTPAGDETYGPVKIDNGLTASTGLSRSFNEVNWKGPWSIFGWVSVPAYAPGNGCEFGASGTVIFNASTRGSVGVLDSGTEFLVGLRRDSYLNGSMPVSAGLHYLGVTYTPGIGVKSFLDGAYTGDTTNNNPTTNTPAGTILIDPSGTNVMPLDEIGIWSKVLSQPEINRLYNGGNGFDPTNPAAK